jgi:hypothetical protein
MGPGNKKNLAANELRQHGPMGLGFFGCWIFVVSQCVTMKFSLFSHQVPNSSSFYPISFALSSTLVTYITCPKEEITIEVSILGLYKA